MEVREIGGFKGRRDLRFLANLIRVVRKVKPDIIQSHLWLTSFYSSISGRILGIPVISTLHSIDGMESIYEKATTKLMYFLSRKVVMVSEIQKELFAFKDRRKKVVVIRNGVNAPCGCGNGLSESENRSLKKELEIGRRDRVIAMIGNMRPVKGHIYLLKAIPLVLKELKNIKVLFIGDGVLKKDLISKCKEYGIADNVKFLGYRDDVEKILEIVDLVVSPSLSEAISMTILEAMVVGKPVVATKVGGTPEIIDDGITGFLVPPMDEEKMAGGIIRILRDGELAFRLGSNGRERVRTKYGLDEMISRYEELYWNVYRNAHA
jgi:glycosyltransferase involved in cell wall biosynthesis